MQRYYTARGLGEEERQETRKSKSKEKLWVLAQPPYSLQENRRQLPRVEPWNQGDRLPVAEENPGSRYGQRLGVQARLWAHSRYIHL